MLSMHVLKLTTTKYDYFAFYSNVIGREQFIFSYFFIYPYRVIYPKKKTTTGAYAELILTGFCLHDKLSHQRNEPCCNSVGQSYLLGLS